ncbi:MAG TPA: aconitate hydratase AcnA [Thermoplasmata archaeon]|nr:aconitate hydratase AcnA [Thermoplasmata archaeon]
MSARDPFGVSEVLEVDGRPYRIFPPDRLPGVDRERLAARPRTVRILLESLLRRGSGGAADAAQARQLAHGGSGEGEREHPFYPARVLLQDFTGVPVVVDLTAIRSAARARGLDPETVNPVLPVDLVVDHSVQVDSFASPRSLLINLDHEYERNSERYRLLRWARSAYEKFRVVPPGNGIVHQVNLEYIASVVTNEGEGPDRVAYPDSLIGTDSHTTMVNGLGVLGWGVGGIEAEAVMLGEPFFLAPPRVVGVRLHGELAVGATATDLVLTITRKLREHGVVDKFVEFYGPGLASLSVADRATISNMCPEYGATAALFPIDAQTVRYLTATGRPAERVALVKAYAQRMGLWSTDGAESIEFDERLELDLGSIVPTVSGPRNPEESVPLSEAPASFQAGLAAYRKEHAPPVAASPAEPGDDPLHPMTVKLNHNSEAPAAAADPHVSDGSVVIAAITSCTNTSNPSVMVGAGLIAQRAVERGLHVPSYVKTSLAPGSKVVTAYLERAGLLAPLSQLGFSLVGYGCTTCIGNAGPLPPPVEKAVREKDAYVAAVLSGNRNFEARIHNLVRANYLMSPMLVVAYALAGRMDVDLAREPLGHSANGTPVRLSDLWPSREEIHRILDASLDPAMFRDRYGAITVGDAHWEQLDAPTGPLYPWETGSSYLREPPYLSAPPPAPATGPLLVAGARALLALGDRVSTDHISPAGEIPAESPAGQYLSGLGVAPAEFNTYGARRGNHEVMVRGTFANIRLRNALAQPKEGGYTTHVPSNALMSVYDAAERYRAEGRPLVVLAGASYGQGSSRDWAAKGPALLGVRAIAAEGFERIHRSNLVGMGVLPFEFAPGTGWKKAGLTGRESFTLRTKGGGPLAPRIEAELVAGPEAGAETVLPGVLRIDSATELEYYRAGGILPFVFEKLAAR